MAKLKTYHADLWGNPQDGYDCNDWFPHETIEIDDFESLEDTALIQKLVDMDFFTSLALTTPYQIDSDEHDIYIRFIQDDGIEDLWRLQVK